MDDQGWRCMTPECGAAETGRVGNEPDWHNTGTGHDVRAYYDGGRFVYDLTDNGWVQVESH